MKKMLCCVIFLFLVVSTSTISFAASFPTEPPYDFYSIAGYTYHGFNLGVVQADRSVIYGSELSEVPYSTLCDLCSQLNSAQSYYRFVVDCVLTSDVGKRYMVNALHSVSSGNGFSTIYEGRLGGYNAPNKDTIIFYAYVPAEAPESTDRVKDIYTVLMEIMLDTSWIYQRCDDFYIELDYLCDKADSIDKGVKNLITTNSLLNNIIRYLDVLADDLEADDSPLLTRLDAIKSSIENIDSGIQSLNTALYDESSSPLLSRLNLIHVALGTPVQGRSVINLLMGMSTDVDRIRVAVNSLSSYDDTNVIAAVNSVETALSNLSFDVGDVTVAPADLTPVITSIDAVGLNIEDLNASLNANFNTNIGSLLDKLDVVIEGSSESLENRINVTIDASNDAHNVFYITGEDGEEQSVTEFTGDLTKASGRLLSLLYRLVFADTLSTVDGDLDGFEDFFTSQEQAETTQDMNTPYEEENVWLAS